MKIHSDFLNDVLRRSKVDPSGFQSSLIDSSGGGGNWQGPHPSILSSAHHYPGRLSLMPPRDMHFPPQHMRQFRPALLPPTSPEYRIYDLNKRLSMRTEECDNFWWESFVNEFFEDDAALIISMFLEEGPKRFHIGRVLIPRFFRTLFDGGVSEVYFILKQTKEMVHHPMISMDCEQGSLITCFGKPSYIKVCIEGHFNIEFTFDDLMRIKSWHFAIKQHRELIPRNVVAIPTDNPSYLDQLSKNFTRNGLTSSMFNFLRLCEILEPMQELMSRHKATTFTPRDCLKTILHQRWSKTCSDTRPAAKPRRKRKSTTGNNNTQLSNKESNVNNGPTPPKKNSSANNIHSQPSVQGMSNVPGDVMIVGEPSLMGGEMDDEDERYISRIENTQFDPNLQYHSSSNPIPQGYQPNPHFQSLLQQKQQQFLPNAPPLLNPNHMKREQLSFPGSPQQQQQLPSMFSHSSPLTNGINSTSNLLPPSTPNNGDVSTSGKKVSTTHANSPPASTVYNHTQNPPTINGPGTPTGSSWNGSTTNNSNSSSSTTNSVLAEKKQEPHTPPVTPQQTVLTAS